ncbi:MAG: MYG1 family protein, partial [Butyricicoccaceae bacterium]
MTITDLFPVSAAAAVTHGGKFHSDDVFGAALLRIIQPDLPIRRVFSVPEDFDGLAFDIGWGAFDHHQPDARFRENGEKYAAFGLLWEVLGAQLLGEADAAAFDEHFVQPLDHSDNTGDPHPLALAIADFNPVWDSDENRDEAFFRAVTFAQGILEREFTRIRARQRADELVRADLAASDGTVVVLSQYAPWADVLMNESQALFAVYPSMRGGYNAQVIPISKDDRT